MTEVDPDKPAVDGRETSADHRYRPRSERHRACRSAPHDPIVARFKPSDRTRPAYGRLATIYCNNIPAVDLLEVVNPDAS